jgi:hypothetical protein
VKRWQPPTAFWPPVTSCGLLAELRPAASSSLSAAFRPSGSSASVLLLPPPPGAFRQARGEELSRKIIVTGEKAAVGQVR